MSDMDNMQLRATLERIAQELSTQTYILRESDLRAQELHPFVLEGWKKAAKRKDDNTELPTLRDWYACEWASIMRDKTPRPTPAECYKWANEMLAMRDELKKFRESIQPPQDAR